MTDDLAEAIKNLSVVRIDYGPGWRVIEPHTLGHGKDGQLLLRAYQVSGASSSGQPEGWKLFCVNKAGGLDQTGESFNGPRPGYRRGDSVMKGGIIAEL